jgi:catalase
MANRKVTPGTQAEDTQKLAAQIKHNANKALEHGHDNAVSPPPGITADPRTAAVTASTVSEANVSAKTGAAAHSGSNETIGTLGRVRADPKLPFCWPMVLRVDLSPD